MGLDFAAKTLEAQADDPAGGAADQGAPGGGTPHKPAPHKRTKGAHVAIRGVSHSYTKADGPVLADIDVEVQPGEVVALIGRSGSGKSTLLHFIAGLSQPTEGEVVIDGARVRRPSPRWVMMFQAPSLYPWMTVAQNAALGLRFTRRMREAEQRVPEVLKLVELSAFADRNVQDLSGGQQQRVALARSLVPNPDVLLLDEPFSALDAFTRGALQRDVRAIAKELGLTMVLVTHDVGEAVLMADRAVVLASGPGRIAAETTIEIADEERDGDSEALPERERQADGALRPHRGPGGDARGRSRPPLFTQLERKAKAMTQKANRPPRAGGAPRRQLGTTTSISRRTSPVARRWTCWRAAVCSPRWARCWPGMPTPSYAQEDEVVRIGYLPITDATALLVAHAKGYFEDEGLEAARPTLIRGWSPLIEGFASNKFNLVHFLKPIPVWMRYNNDFPVKVMSWAHTNGSGLVVGRHTDITDFSQLAASRSRCPLVLDAQYRAAIRPAGVGRHAGDPGPGRAVGPNQCNLQVLPPPEMPPRSPPGRSTPTSSPSPSTRWAS